jgi:hypothetical protein
MVYELYLSACEHAQAGFPDEIKAAVCEVLKHLTNLPEFDDNQTDEQKLAIIENLCCELSDPAHPVAVAMQKMRDIPKIRIIEGRK